jgi:hypothetical protein
VRGPAFRIISATVTTAGGAHDQQHVLYYAASMFTSFLAGLLAIARRARGNADTNRSSQRRDFCSWDRPTQIAQAGWAGLWVWIA